MAAKVLNDYRIVVSGDEFNAPEIRRFHLQGELHNGMKATTSPIVSVDDDIVTTRSGSTYILGTRAAGFKSWDELRAKHPGVPLSTLEGQYA